ncbi:MAG: ComF family protein [Gammaproteobacteria bacterium]|nr:ComF family protein [Gammaproteobacteria bacterium]
MGQPLCAGCAEDLPWRREMIHVQDLPVQIAFAYQWPINRLIHLYKYQARLEFMSIFEYGLSQLEPPEADALLAVPVSLDRLRERGFNQSHEIAKRMADYWSMPLLNHIKRREGVRQKGLGRSERLQNLEDAFEVEQKTTTRLPKRIVLIDDVLTTGNTLLSLATYLRAQGVEQVSAFVVASQHQYRALNSTLF